MILNNLPKSANYQIGLEITYNKIYLIKLMMSKMINKMLI
jgi:hypothetical protein